MKKSYKEEFLEEFRKIETTLRTERGQDYAFRDYEETDDGKDSLRLCRSGRNYLTHNPDSDSIIPVPKELYIFLQGKRKQLEKESKTAKDIASRVKPLTMQDPVSYAAKRLQKNPVMPVVEEGGKLIANMTRDTLVSCIAAGMKSESPIGKAAMPKDTSGWCVTLDALYSDISEELEEKGSMVVVDPMSGKYCGLVTK